MSVLLTYLNQNDRYFGPIDFNVWNQLVKEHTIFFSSAQLVPDKNWTRYHLGTISIRVTINPEYLKAYNLFGDIIETNITFEEMSKSLNGLGIEMIDHLDPSTDNPDFNEMVSKLKEVTNFFKQAHV